MLLVLCVVAFVVLIFITLYPPAREAERERKNIFRNTRVLIEIFKLGDSKQRRGICVHFGWLDPLGKLCAPEIGEYPVTFRAMGCAYAWLLSTRGLEYRELWRVVEAVSLFPLPEREEFLEGTKDTGLYETLRHYVAREMARLTPLP